MKDVEETMIKRSKGFIRGTKLLVWFEKYKETCGTTVIEEGETRQGTLTVPLKRGEVEGSSGLTKEYSASVI